MRQVERTTRKTTTEAIHRTDDGNAQNSESSEGRDRRSPAASASPPHQLRHWTEQLETLAGRVRQVVKQTRARIFGGITHSPSKIVSLFEPHTEERPTHHLSEAGTRSSRENGLSKRRPAKPGLGKSLWDFHFPTTILTGSPRSSAKSVPYLLSRNYR